LTQVVIWWLFSGYLVVLLWLFGGYLMTGRNILKRQW